ncbi:MAG: ABC transporter permease [Eubacteriales bacterium]|nr:ABC transporter permease [Eubacteriales bacterium]
MNKRMKKIVNTFGVPRLIIMGYLLVLLIAMPFMGLQMEMLYTQAFGRIGMYGVLVLAMLPAIESGIKMNMALPLGVLCGLFGGAMSLEAGLDGWGGFAGAIAISIPIAVVVGILYGIILNKIKGSEMMIATYSGYTAVAVMCIVWMALPVRNAEIRWPQGNGVRSIVTLTGKYEKILDHFLEISITDELIFPTGLFLFFGGACLLVWLFMRSRTGILMKTAGSNPVLAEATGISVNKMRILGMTISTVLGAVGIIVYAQSYGFFQYYMAPLNMAFIAVAAILIGGATVGKATIFNVVLGTILYQSIMTFTLPIANVIMPEGNLSEIVRIIIQNGIILYALTKAGEHR